MYVCVCVYIYIYIHIHIQYMRGAGVRVSADQALHGDAGHLTSV